MLRPINIHLYAYHFHPIGWSSCHKQTNPWIFIRTGCVSRLKLCGWLFSSGGAHNPSQKGSQKPFIYCEKHVQNLNIENRIRPQIVSLNDSPSWLILRVQLPGWYCLASPDVTEKPLTNYKACFQLHGVLIEVLLSALSTVGRKLLGTWCLISFKHSLTALLKSEVITRRLQDGLE